MKETITDIMMFKPMLNKISHQSLMQTEKSQPESKQNSAGEMRVSEFQALSIDPRVGIYWSESETDD